MPCPRDPTPSGGPGSYWLIGERRYHDNAEPLHLAFAYWWDAWRRGEAARLIAERGLGRDVLEAVWARLPRESVMFRHGWDEWRRRREAAGG